MKKLKEIHSEINFSGLQNLKKYISKKYKNLYTGKQIEDYYSGSEINQRTEKIKPRRKFNKVLPIRENEENILQPVGFGKIIYLDTSFIKYTKPNQMAVIIAMDHYSRKIWLKVVRLKKIKNQMAYEGVKSKHTLELMKRVIQETKIDPIEIITDNGREFLGQFNKEFKDIHRIFLENQKLLLGIIESHVKTIKMLWVNYYEMNPKDRDYEQIFEKIEDIYNNRSHSGIINLTPNEASQNPIGLHTYYMELLSNSGPVKVFPLPVGTQLRLWKPNKNSFDSLRPQWSKKIYVLEEENINRILKKYTNFDGSKRLYDVNEVKLVKKINESDTESEIEVPENNELPAENEIPAENELPAQNELPERRTSTRNRKRNQFLDDFV